MVYKNCVRPPQVRPAKVGQQLKEMTKILESGGAGQDHPGPHQVLGSRNLNLTAALIAPAPQKRCSVKFRQVPPMGAYERQ